MIACSPGCPLRSPGRAAVAILLVVLIPWAIIAPRVISPSQPAAAPNVSVPTATAPILPTAPSTSTAAPQPSPTARPAAPTTAYVVHVVDGDTLVVQIDGQRYKVRLIGVDAPESTVEPYGRKATDFTSKRLLGKTVYLEKDVSEQDRYGRALRYVWLVVPPSEPTEEQVRRYLFNAILVLEGYARVATYPPDVKYADLLVKLEGEAREARRGLWGLEDGGQDRATGGSGGKRCDPAYPDVCIPPPPPDLDCGDIPYRGFRVLPPDPHHFDRDRDGVGCEK